MTTSTFIQLPAEIRNQIYGYLFEGALIEDYGLSPTPVRTDSYHYAITMTNRQIRAESLAMLRVATTFHFRVGQTGGTPVPAHVLREVRTVRLPAHRLKTLDTSSFTQLNTLILDVNIDPDIWQFYVLSRNMSKGSLADVSDMVNVGMMLGVFEYSWDLDKVWRDKDRKFKILCWFSSWVQGERGRQPVLVDLDSGMILKETQQT